jgi:hypothetical protein
MGCVGSVSMHEEDWDLSLAISITHLFSGLAISHLIQLLFLTADYLPGKPEMIEQGASTICVPDTYASELVGRLESRVSLGCVSLRES